MVFRIWASWLSVISLTSWPSRRYSPSVGTSRAPMMFISVDFPLPDFPTMATNSPFSMVREIPSLARTSSSPIW